VTSPTVIETRRAGQTNERVELARYTISAGERAVDSQRVLGVVRLTDVVVEGDERHYLIERGLTSNVEPHAVVDDYLGQAEHWDAVPAEPCWIAEKLEPLRS
jgi:hypothetical protein